MRRVGLLRRYGVALLMTGTLVYVFVHDTLPAIHERRAMRVRLQDEERRLESVRQDVRVQELWLRGVEQDALLRERFLDAWRHSPDVPSLREIAPPDDGSGGEPTAQG